MDAPPTATGLRAAFDAPEPLTVGLEEEVMLLDPQTLDLAPVAARVLERLDGDERFKGELPASQVEIVTRPARSVGEAIGELAAARRHLAEACKGLARPAVAGAHPFAKALGELSAGERYDAILAEYGDIARSQLVCALQIHVAVGGADRTLAAYNALRPQLPLLAALAANAPFHAGSDTGLASVRPTIAERLPRQGMPPPIASWEDFAADLAWGAASGTVPEARLWWWELRPHPRYGTLELRVPDAQATVADAGAVAAVAHCLVAQLADRGDPPPAAGTWRLEENRWSACRHGLDGTMADVETGHRTATRDLVRALLDDLAPVAERLGCAAELRKAQALASANGAERQRLVAGDGGPQAVAAWLADRFAEGA